MEDLQEAPSSAEETADCAKIPRRCQDPGQGGARSAVYQRTEVANEVANGIGDWQYSFFKLITALPWRMSRFSKEACSFFS